MSWSGVYKDFTEINSHYTYNLNNWVSVEIQRINNISSEIEALRKDAKDLINNLDKNKTNKIIDFGGSLGITYFTIKDMCDIEYHIVETNKIVKKGNELFKGNPIFHESIPINDNFDIVFIRTALQYSINWKNDIESLVKLNPTKMIFTHSSIGDIPSYISTQKWGKNYIPYQFINFNEFNDLVTSFGYSLTSNEVKQHIKDNGRWYNIPENYRLKKTLNLVYER